MGEHRLGNEISQDDADGTFPGGKNSLYEEDIRVPLWVRGPGVSVSTVDHLIGNVDLAPTFCDIAGIDLDSPPDVIDGRSFLPLLAGQSIPWRSQYLISRGQAKPYVGIRHADEWVFGQLITPAAQEVGGEYYLGLDDLATGDPFELENQYVDLATNDPDRLDALVTLAGNYSQCSGDTCRLYDSQTI
jgi:arylsulfatase A-like enzyme